MGKLLLGLLAVVVLAVWWFFKSSPHREIPHLPLDQWWGPNDLKGRVDNSIRTFKIKFDEATIIDLKDRLKRHRPITPPLEGVAFEYGFNQAQLDSWVNYWADKYPFAEREKFLNTFPQFKTNIQGLDIHFIRVKPQVPANVKVLPILLMHGWPGSVREFYEAIPLLTKQTPGYDFVFEVIVPSLPGYGFSDGAVRPGLSAFHVSVVMRNLMHRLGFKKFYIQGGDWGAAIASGMATLFPEEVLGHHSNCPFVMNKQIMPQWFLGSFFPSLVVESHLAERMYPISKVFSFFMEEMGYLHIQATKPDTVGVGLSDSPSGLLAYILEKFSTWTAKEHKHLKDGGLTKKFSKDQLIDNLMIYWTTNTITTSMRLYSEQFSSNGMTLGIDEIPTPVPTWTLQAKNELAYFSPHLLQKKYTNLVGNTVLEDGGHFLAFELPQVFSEDVFKAVKAFREHALRQNKTEL